MQLVLLAAELGKKYGERHEYYNLHTPADAIKLLCINYPALKKELMEAHHHGVGYKVVQGGKAMGYDELQLPLGSKPLFVVPVITGAGGGPTTSILVGVGLVAASFLLPGAGLFGATSVFGVSALTTATGAATFATALGTSLSAIGAGLILSGTAEIVSPQPALNAAGRNRIRGEGTNVRGGSPDGITRGAMGKSNYAFTGPANTVGTGVTVPVVYGRVITGSHLLAANLEVSDDSDPLKIATQSPGIETFRINGDKVTRTLEKHGGLRGRKFVNDLQSTNKNSRVKVNKIFGKNGQALIEPEETLESDELKHRNEVRKELDILFKIDNGLFDFVAGEGSTKIDGFIKYRITVELTGPGSNPRVATADATIQGLLLKNQNVKYGHRLQMPKVTGRDDVRVNIEIMDAGVHDQANLIFHGYGYNLLT